MRQYWQAVLMQLGLRSPHTPHPVVSVLWFLPHRLKVNLETVRKGLCTVLSPLLAGGLSFTWPWITVEVRTGFNLWVLDNLSSLDCLLTLRVQWPWLLCVLPYWIPTSSGSARGPQLGSYLIHSCWLCCLEGGTTREMFWSPLWILDYSSLSPSAS